MEVLIRVFAAHAHIGVWIKLLAEQQSKGGEKDRVESTFSAFLNPIFLYFHLSFIQLSVQNRALWKYWHLQIFWI